MMGKRGTVVLLVLFFGGLGALWWVRSAGLPTAKERREMAGRVLPELLKVEPTEITRVEIEEPGRGGRIALERRGPGSWQIVEPINALASGRMANSLVENLKALRKSTEAGDISGEPARFGLEPAGRVIRLFRDEQGEPICSIALGDELEQLRYVRPEGGAITLADALRVEPNGTDPLDWRERSLFEIYSYDVKSINVVGPGRRLNAVLDGERWRVVHPFRAPGNAETINGLLADLADLEAIAGAEGFVAEDVTDFAPYGLDDEHRTIITLLSAGLTGPSEPQMAYLGHAPEGQDDLRFARREGQDEVLLVRARGIGEIGLDPIRARSPKVFDVRPGDFAGFQIEADGRMYRLSRSDRGWTVSTPDAGEGLADTLDLSTMLETLAALESATFLPVDEVSEPGFDAPLATLAAWLDRPDPGQDDGPVFERPANTTLRLGRFDGGRKLVYGQTDGDESIVLTLPDTVLQVLPEGPLAYRDRTIVRQDPRTIDRVELTRGRRTLALEKPDPSGGWQVVEPSPAPADRLATTMLVEGLSRLRAERRIGDEGDEHLVSDFGLDEPGVRVTWRASAGDPSTRTLVVGDENPGHPEERFAKLEGEPGIFTIGPKLIAVLSAEFRERRLLAFPVEQLSRIALKGPGGEEEAFSRTEAGGWEPEAGPESWPVGLDSARIQALAEALAELTADRIVQDDGPMPEATGLEPPMLSIEVTLVDPDGVATVRLGTVLGGLRFAAMGGEGPGAVSVVPAGPFEGLRVPVAAPEPEPESAEVAPEPDGH